MCAPPLKTRSNDEDTATRVTLLFVIVTVFEQRKSKEGCESDVVTLLIVVFPFTYLPLGCLSFAMSRVPIEVMFSMINDPVPYVMFWTENVFPDGIVRERRLDDDVNFK